MATEVELQFLGGAGTVTGSKTLVKFNGLKILIDCGLFQGLKPLRELNWKDIPVDESKVDAVILTHAHLDHTGYLPLLTRNGFVGTTYCTHPTMDLTEIILRDSAKIQVEDAERANRYNYSRHQQAKPLYTERDVNKAMETFSAHNYGEWVIIGQQIKFRFVNAGHILGSAMVEMNIAGEHFLFSGDVGRHDPLLLDPPKRLDKIDYLILESTYGDRKHRIEDVENTLKTIVNETIERGGILMIPSFAVERTQELIYILYHLREREEIPNVPVFLDSPMGVRSTEVFEKYPDWQSISKEEVRQMYDWVNFILDGENSRAVVKDRKPKIVLAGSGMLEGGRILHYLNTHLNNPNNTLLFVGFQAAGTRGRSIVQGAQEIKFFGEYHEIKCKVESISSMSAHADRSEMANWLSHFKELPKNIYLNHGEPHQSNALRVYLQSKFDVEVTIPVMNEKFLIPIAEPIDHYQNQG